MTYNLRYASQTSPNSWPERRPVAKRLIEQAKPDLIGTQEGLFEQLNDLAVGHAGGSWLDDLG